MALPLLIADTIARTVQKLPGAPRIADEVAYRHLAPSTRRTIIPTRHGAIGADVYGPPEPRASTGVYLNFHGGGFVLRHPEQDDALCRYIAATAGVTVLNVDYIPAPQSRFPGPVEQAYDAVVWAATEGHAWNVSRIAVGGQSAGGALAAGAARLAFEEGGPAISLHVLMYPPLDLTIPATQKVADGKERFLVRMGPIFDTVYCPDIARRADRLVSPAGPADTASLTGIAPALIVTAQRDILREETGRYAQRLRQDGALIDHIDLDGVGHGFNILGSHPEIVGPVYRRIADEARRALAA